MTAIRSVDSLKYGSRLFLYLLGVLVVGGGVLGLGLALGLDHAQAFLDDAAYSKTELAGGAVLTFIGSFTLLTGLFGLVHKLIADSVATGAAEIADSASAGAGVASSGTTAGTVTPNSTSSTGPSPGEQSAQKHGDGDGHASETEPEPEPTEEDEPTEQPEQAEKPRDESEPQQPGPVTEPDELVAGDSTSGEQTGDAPDTLAEAVLTEEQPSERATHGADQEVESVDQPIDRDAGDTSSPADDELTTAWDDETETPSSAVDSEDHIEDPSTDGETGPETSVDEGPKRVPSPEEIAFGSDTEEPETQETEEPDDEETGQSSESRDSGGGGFGSDPLGGPTDE